MGRLVECGVKDEDLIRICKVLLCRDVELFIEFGYVVHQYGS